MPEETNSLIVSSIAENTYVKTYSADRRPALALIGNVTAVAITLLVSCVPSIDYRRTQQRSRRCRKSTGQLCYMSTYVDVREVPLPYDRDGAEHQDAERVSAGVSTPSRDVQCPGAQDSMPLRCDVVGVEDSRQYGVDDRDILLTDARMSCVVLKSA